MNDFSVMAFLGIFDLGFSFNLGLKEGAHVFFHFMLQLLPPNFPSLEFLEPIHLIHLLHFLLLEHLCEFRLKPLAVDFILPKLLGV